MAFKLASAFVEFTTKGITGSGGVFAAIGGIKTGLTSMVGAVGGAVGAIGGIAQSFHFVAEGGKKAFQAIDFFLKSSEQTKTLWSNFTGQFVSFMQEIGEAIITGFDIPGLIANMQVGLAVFREEWMPTIRGAISLMAFLGGKIVEGGKYLIGLAKAFDDWTGNAISSLTDFITYWDVSWKILWELTKLTFSNMWERIKTFGINVGEIAMWIFRNWDKIAMDWFNAQITIYSNLWTNIKNGWQALLDFFAGRPVNFEWTPLLEGFKSTIEQFPELTKANIAKSNAEIDKLRAELTRRKIHDQMTTEAAPTIAGPGEQPGAGGQRGGGGGSRDQGFAFVGLAQLAEKMQQEAGKRAEDREKTDLAKRQAAASEKLAMAVEGSALKVVMQGGIAAPVYDPAAG